MGNNIKDDFDPLGFYESYPSKVILRPGYPARAQYKSTMMWKLFGHHILNSLGKIDSYADIGGCFGFGANAMAFQIFKSQGAYPKTKVFEISEDFVKIGRQLFPYIDFVQKDIGESGYDHIFDLITLFDVIEHIPNPNLFLMNVADISKYALLITPTETGGDWFGSMAPKNQGIEHEDGHINFFTPKSYLLLLKNSGWELIDGKFILSLANITSKNVLMPEEHNKINKKGFLYKLSVSGIVPSSLYRKIWGGGFHLGLAKSLGCDL